MDEDLLHYYPVNRDGISPFELLLKGHILLEKNDGRALGWRKDFNPEIEILKSQMPGYVTKSGKLLASRLGIKEKQVLLSDSGSVKLIDLAARISGHPRTVLLPHPSWEHYKILPGIRDAVVEEYELRRNPDGWEYDKNAIILKSKGKNLIIIASPNNPTGNKITVNDIGEVAESASDSIILVDQAYEDILETSTVNLIQRHDNLFITRGISKRGTLCGVRYGCAITSERLAESYYRMYPEDFEEELERRIDSKPDALASELIKHWKFYHRKWLDFRKKGTKCCEKISSKLAEKVRVYPCEETNFFLLELEPSYKPSDLVRFLNQEMKIKIKDLSPYTRLENFVRISLGTQQEMRRLYQGLLKFFD